MEEYKRIHLIEISRNWNDPEIADLHNPGSNGGRTTVRKVWMDCHDFRSHTKSTHAYESFDYDAAIAWAQEHHYKVARDDATVVMLVHDSCPDRIDMTVVNGTVKIIHFDRRGMNDIRRDFYTVEDVSNPFNAPGVTPNPKHWLTRVGAWLEDHGYTVFNWGSGLRAFRGDPWPIRTRREIWKKRQQVEERAVSLMKQEPGTWHAEDTLMQMDLAYAG